MKHQTVEIAIDRRKENVIQRGETHSFGRGPTIQQPEVMILRAQMFTASARRGILLRYPRGGVYMDKRASSLLAAGLLLAGLFATTALALAQTKTEGANMPKVGDTRS